MRRVFQPLCSHVLLGNSNKVLPAQSLSLKRVVF